LLDEDRTLGLEIADHVRVVDDLLADEDGTAVRLERPLARLDGALDPRAIAPGSGEQDLGRHVPMLRDKAVTFGHSLVGGAGTVVRTQTDVRVRPSPLPLVVHLPAMGG